MLTFLAAPFVLARALLKDPRELAAENLALRQQLAVLKRKRRRSRLRKGDRVFWVWLSRLWAGWRSALIIVEPATVVKWHRLGFRLYWARKSKSGRTGRPSVKAEIRRLIRRMCRENPTWGAPRILSELFTLGYDAAQSTVSRYLPRPRKPPSQTWRTFLANHASEIAAIAGVEDDRFRAFFTERRLRSLTGLVTDREKLARFAELAAQATG